MAANTGVGLPGAATSSNLGSLTMNLGNGDVPQFKSDTNSLEPSGFSINQITQALRGNQDIITAGTVEAGVSTFRLGTAHEIRSAAENITFRNIVTNTVFHPTWQTTEENGAWASIQRTPIGNLITNFAFQSVGTETVTNPDFEFTSLPFNHRLYGVQIQPLAAADNVVVIIQQNNGTEFVDYWRSQPIDFTIGTMQNIAINPFIDLFASTTYRLMTVSANTVTVQGNAAGIPRILLNYRQWEDRPLVTSQDVGQFRFDDSVEISGNVTITSPNLETYNRKIWVITGSGQKDITISEGLNLFYFGVHVLDSAGSVFLSGPGGASTLRIDDGVNARYTGGESAVIFRAAANNYRVISNNLEGSGTASTTFSALTDTPANIPALQYARGNGAGNAIEFINPFVIDGTIDIRSDVTITSANAATYNRRIWQVTGGSRTVTIAEGSGLTFFGFYVRRMGDTGTIVVTGTDSRINGGTANIVLESMQSSTYFAIRANRYNELYNNFRPAGFVNLDDTPSALGTAGQLVAVNSGRTALEFVNPPETTNALIFVGSIEITADITLTLANVANYNRRIWRFTGAHTVTLTAGLTLSYFAGYAMGLQNAGTITAAAGSDVRLDFGTEIILNGRSGATFFQPTANRYRTLSRNSIGVNITDNGVTEGRQITELNFNENINVSVSDGVATINALTNGEVVQRTVDIFLTQPQRDFLNTVIRGPVTLGTQQTGNFDINIYANPINHTNTGAGSDLAALNALNQQTITSTTGGGSLRGFVYLLFQNAGQPVSGATLVRTNAGRTQATFVADLSRDFTEIVLTGVSIRLFMSNHRVIYNENDVLAVYTITGGDRVTIEQSNNLNLINGLPNSSIAPEKLNFPIRNALTWFPCTLNTQTGVFPIVTLPQGQTIADYSEVTIYWRSGDGTPISGENGNINRLLSVQGSLLPIVGGLIPANQFYIVGSYGRGNDDITIQIQQVASTSNTFRVYVSNINATGGTVPRSFNVRNVWVR